MSCLSNFMVVFSLIIVILVHSFQTVAVFLGAAEFLKSIHPMVMRVWKERQDVQYWEPKCVCQKRVLW